MPRTAVSDPSVHAIAAIHTEQAVPQRGDDDLLLNVLRSGHSTRCLKYSEEELIRMNCGKARSLGASVSLALIRMNSKLSLRRQKIMRVCALLLTHMNTYPFGIGVLCSWVPAPLGCGSTACTGVRRSNMEGKLRQSQVRANTRQLAQQPYKR